MAKFCGKCGTRLDENTGLCPNCTLNQTNSQQNNQPSDDTFVSQNVQTADNIPDSTDAYQQYQQQEYDNQTYGGVSTQYHGDCSEQYIPPRATTKQEIKAKRKADKAARKAARTKGQKVRSILLKLLAVILALAVIISAVTVVLVYLKAIDVPFVSSALKSAGLMNEENIASDATTETLLDSTETTGRVQGVIHIEGSDENAYIANAEVAFVKQGETEPCVTVESDERGCFDVTLDDGKYTVIITVDGFEEYTEEITVTSEVICKLEDVALTEESNLTGEFVSDDNIVRCGDKVFYADQQGVWVTDETTNDTKLLNKCKAKNLTTNGKVIFYSVYNKEQSGYSSMIGETKWYQYDLYSINADGTDNQKVFSFNECGEPKCVIDNVLYYTDFPGDYDGNCVGLSRSLFSYNFQTNEKTKISDGADLVAYYNDKIYFRDMIVSADIIGRAQIYCYDTKKDKIDRFTDEGAAAFIIDKGKLLYSTFAYSTKSVSTKVYMCDLDSGNKQTLLDMTTESNISIQYMDSSYIYYAIRNGDLNQNYRINISTGADEILSAKSAYIDEKYLNVVKDGNCAYYYAFDNGGLAILKLEDSSNAIEFISSEEHTCSRLLGIFDDGVYLVDNYDFYFYIITRYTFDDK